MESSTQTGHNRTGIKTFKGDREDLLKNEAAAGTLEEIEPLLEGETTMRQEYIVDADALGSIPRPAKLGAALKSGAQMLTGRNPQVLIDKLAERAAFERGGTRLYDAFLTKLATDSEGARTISLARAREIRDEEAEHYRLVARCIESLGGDSTVQTPSADLVGVQTMGLIQVMNDPRTSIAHCVHTLLTAELTDSAGWELLISLAIGFGQDEMADEFRVAFEAEGEHLADVRTWDQELTFAASGIALRAQSTERSDA